MANKTSNEASIPNPALDVFKNLIGSWKTTGTHPLVPGITFHGKTSFEWIEGGAFMMMRSEIDEKEIPSAVAIFGSDDNLGELYMIYFDERKISRKYDVFIDRHDICWKRDAPGFFQTNRLSFSNDGNTITGHGEICKDGNTWEDDLQLTYSRVPSSH